MIVIVSQTTQAKSILVLGDSISASYGMEVEQGWVSLLVQKLKTEDKDYRVLNESVSGETTAGGLARVGKLLKLHQPGLLILELGANDGLRGLPPKKMKENLANIIRLSQKAGAKVLLLSMRIPPNYGKRYTHMFYQVYPQLSEEFGIPLVPFILNDVALIADLMQQDGLHPNAKAQPLIVDKMWSYVKALLQ